MKQFLYFQIIFSFLFSFGNMLFGQETKYKVEYSIEHNIYDWPDDDTDDDDVSELRIRFANSDINIYNETLRFPDDENGIITEFDDVITTTDPETQLEYFYDTECPENNFQPFNNTFGIINGCREVLLDNALIAWSPCVNITENYGRVVQLPSLLKDLNDDTTLKVCEPYTIEVAAACQATQFSYAIDYRLRDSSGSIIDQGELSSYSLKSPSFTFDLTDITNENPSNLGIFDLIVRYVENPTIASHSAILALSPTACSPQLIPNLTTIENQSCYNIADGEVTLTFDSNIDSANDYQMRYFIFQGTPPTNPSSEDLESENPPFPNQAFADPLGIPLVPAGGGNFEGTAIGLDGSFTDTNGVTFDTADYYIIYQEVRYDEPNPGDVDVKSAEITPAFTIARPSQIIASGSIEAPQFCGDTAKISFGASGGNNLDSSGSYSYQFRINSTNDADWSNISSNPQPVALINIEQTVQIRAQYSVNGCFSDAITLTDIIEATAPELTLTNPSPGEASSNVIDDGVISIEFGGGTPSNTTPGYTFELLKENAANGFDIVSVPPIDIILTGNRIEYRNLGVGTYRITIRDANSCTLTSDDIAVTTIAPPVLSALSVTPISCNNANDATISVNATYSSATTFTYELRDGSVIATSNLIRTGQVDYLNPPAEEVITITTVPPGTYWLFVRASAGGFSSVSIPEITNPDPITVSITAIPFTCSDSTDGSITVVASGATNYDYQLSTDVFNWFPLTGTTIPVSDPNFYRVTLRDRENPSCASAISDQVEVTRPLAISITEIPIGHIDVSANGLSDGALEILVENGTAGYTYSWTRSETLTGAKTAFTPPTPSTDTNLVDIPFGFYQVTLTDDANICPDVVGPEIEITQPGPLGITDFIGTDTCNGLPSGKLTATVQGTGNITFEFLLNPGPGETVLPAFTNADRTVTISDLAAGTYGLRITEEDSGNVVTTPTENYVIITELATITASINPTDATCALPNSGTITISGVTGGSPFITGPNALTGYEYRINDTFNNFQPEANFNGLAADEYIVTVRDALGCEYNETVTIGAGELPVVDDLTTVVNNASSATSLDGSITLNFTNPDISGYTYAWSGPDITNPNTKDQASLGDGAYQVIVTAPGNCTLPIDFTVGVQSAFSIQSFTGTATCFNQSIGSLTATIEATGLVTFNWILDDGTVNGTLVASETTALRTLSTQGLDAGTYYLEIVNDNAQTLRSTNLVDIAELAEVSAIVTPVPTCLGEATGSITFTVPTGSPSNSYTYSIDNGVTFQAGPIFENLAAATYTPRVSAFENPNCDYIAPGVTITNSPILFWDLPNSIITRTSGPGATDGAISAAFTGGTAPYTFLWNPNPTNSTIQNITGVGAGIYNLTITDASSCSISQDFEVTEVGPLSITNIVPTAVLCRGEANGSITTTVTGEGTINYVWTLANGDPVPVSNGVNGPNITGIAAGNYILTATDINSTVATASIAIGEPATALSISNITPNNISCFGGSDGSIAIAATGGSGGYTFSINGGAFQPSPINGLIANSYTIRVRDANDCEFTEPTPVLLTEPEELNLIINEQRPVTAASATDGAIFITAEGGSGNYTYNWTGPNGYTSTEEDILSLGAGDYNVTITDANFGINNDAGCRLISNAITIAEPGVLIATINQSVFLECSGDDFAEITANVQGGVLPYVYDWFQVTNGNNTALTEDTDIIANLSAGTYFLRVTDANSVTRDTNPVVITAPSQVVVTIDNTTNVLCVGQPTGSANITVTGGTPPYQYFWSNASTVADVSGLDAGEYTIEVEDSNGCNAQNTITITAPDDAIQIADVTLTNVSVYQAVDGSISLDVNGGSAPYNYAWTRISDNSNAGNQATISNLAADSYTVVVSDANGCTITETYEVTQPDIIDETIIQPSCTDESDGSISVLVNQGNGTFTYIWNTGSTENNITNLGAGNYSVTVTGLADGPVTRTYVLQNPVPLEVNLGLDRVLCAGQVLELDGTVDDETASYSWTSDTGFTSSNAVVVLNQTGNYTLTVQSQTGCTTQGTIFVDISTDVIDAEFAVSSQVFIGETIVAVDISYPLPDVIEWILPIGAEISTQDKDAVEFSFAEAGEYDITIINTRGDCIAQKTKKILVVAKDGLIQEEDDKSGQKLVEEFIVYPNPTSGRFTADINLTERGDVSVKVFSFSNNSLMASQKERGETSYSIPFDISGMPSGVYAVLLETPYGTSLRKIVVR